MSWLPAVAGFAGSLFSSSANQASAQASMDFQREVLQNRNQWMVEDLRKAGLNPILAAGITQSTAQGATYQTDNPASGSSSVSTTSPNNGVESRNIILNSDLSALSIRATEYLQRWKEVVQFSSKDYSDQMAAQFGIKAPEYMGNHAHYIGGWSNVIKIMLEWYSITAADSVTAAYRGEF